MSEALGTAPGRSSRFAMVSRTVADGARRRQTVAEHKIGIYQRSCWSKLVLLVDGGAPGRIRTCDTRFRKPMLYPLSYEG